MEARAGDPPFEKQENTSKERDKLLRDEKLG